MLDKKEYQELVMKLAGEYCEEFLGLEKTAGLVGYIKGDRDFSDEKDQKTKFWGDRVAPAVVGAGALAGYGANAIANRTVVPGAQREAVGKVIGALNSDGVDEKGLLKTVLKASLNPKLLAASAGVMGAAGGARYLRGKNMAEQNGVDFTAGDAVKSAFAPFATEDSIVKKKVRQKATQDAVIQKAAELLVEAVMVKEASVVQAEQAEMYVEAAEHALGSIGYNLDMER